jgi:3-deoxy-D-manno-octulosonic-acid transferase
MCGWIWLYRLLYVPVFFLLFPLHLPKVWRRGGYWDSLTQRFGFYDSVPANDFKRRRLWIQVVSVGEAQAAMPLITSLLSRDDCCVMVTTTTATAYRLLRARLAGQEHAWLGYFPFDFVFSSVRAWRQLCPDLAILFESELWPEHLHQAKKRGVPVWLMNARHSDVSIAWYRYFPWLLRWLYQGVGRVFAVSDQQLATLRSLGVVLEGSRAVGQLKFDMCMTELSDACFRKVSSATRYLLGVSIWPGEEVILLEACRLLRSQGRDVRLLLIPRHAERADGMLKNIRSMGFSVSRRSTQTNVMEDVVVHLADTTGEMHALCQCGHLGLVGKSFAPYVGGQTPLELALCGVPMVYGPEMSNFREICEMLESEGLVSKVMTAQEAVQVLVTKMQDENALERVGQGLQVWAKQHTGVVLTYLDELSVFLGV